MKGAFARLLVLASAFTFAVTWTVLDGGVKTPAYYPKCDAARAAGAAPIHRGHPGYRSELDGDDDGIACETFGG